MDESKEQRERAAGRAGWPVRRFELGQESDDLSAVSSAEERIAMMWPLALEAWSLAGLPPEQANYIGVPVEGPYKSKHYRY